MAQGRRASVEATPTSTRFPTFHHDAHAFSATRHGDEFLAEGSGRSMRCQGSAKNRASGFWRTGCWRKPPRAHHCLDVRGFTWCGNPQHVAGVITLMGFSSGSRGSSTPAPKATGKNMRNAMDVLTNERAELFRKVAGTGLYIAIDRPPVQFAMHEVMSGMSTPTVMHWAKLHALRTPEMLEVLTRTPIGLPTQKH